MPTFNTTKNDIIKELMPNAAGTSSLDTAVSNALISAIKFYQGEKFIFNTDERTSYVSVADTRDISLADSVLGIQDVFIVNQGTDRTELKSRPFKWIKRRLYTETSTGIPEYYSFVKNKLSFYPVPNASRTVSVSFHSSLGDPPGSASGSTITAWLEEGVDLIKARSKIFVAENVIRDFAYATSLRLQEAEIYTKMKDRFTDYTNQGFIKGSI